MRFEGLLDRHERGRARCDCHEGCSPAGPGSGCLAEHNAAFAIAPAKAGSAFVLDRAGAARETLYLQEERRVGNDNTVKWRGLILQILLSPLRPHFVPATMRVHEDPTAGSRSSTARIVSPITIRKERCARTPNWLREPLRQPATANDQLIRYKQRTI